MVWTGRGHVEAIDAVECNNFVTKIPISCHVVAHICQYDDILHEREKCVNYVRKRNRKNQQKTYIDSFISMSYRLVRSTHCVAQKSIRPRQNWQYL